MPSSDQTILALDVGSKRIGVAVAGAVARLASPLTTVQQSADILEQLQELVAAQQAKAVVVGLPRNLEGDDTPQTREVRQFADSLKQTLSIPLYYQDEALTSKTAEAELEQRGVPYNKGMVDALAAAYILSDFLGDHPEV